MAVWWIANDVYENTAPLIRFRVRHYTDVETIDSAVGIAAYLTQSSQAV